MDKLEYSSLDSNRFGLIIYRANLPEINEQLILEQILSHHIDVAIVRIPSTRLSQLHQLKKTAMPFMVTDTLAYYRRNLPNTVPSQALDPNVSFFIAQPGNHPGINQIVREVLGDYMNHYRMNPFFDNEQVTEGYQDWVRSYAENNPKRICILAKKHEEIVGFATFNLEEEEKAKGILYGVKPTERKKGIFKQMMYCGEVYAIRQGKDYMETTSQIENLPVQQAWTKQGFSLHHTINTIHINAMLTKSVFDKFTIKTVLESEDFNPKKVSNRHILKHINYQFDFKQNIVTQNHSFVNIKPLKPKHTYLLKFSFPVGNKGLLRVFDEKEKNTYMLVYFDLKHFLA